MDSSIRDLRIRVSALERDLANSRKNTSENKKMVEERNSQPIKDSVTVDDYSSHKREKIETCRNQTRDISTEEFNRASVEPEKIPTFSISKFIDEYVVSKIFLWLGGLR